MSSFLKNTTKLLGGNVFAQIIGIIAIPIITRIYNTEQYGSFAITLSIATIISSVSTLGFHLAILIPKENSTAKALAKISLISLILTSLPISLASLINPSLLIYFLGSNIDQNTIRVISIMVISQGLYSIASYWCIREKKFGAVATSKIFESISDRGIAIGAAAFGWASAISLSFARIFGVIISLVFLLFTIRTTRTEKNASDLSTSTTSIYSTFKDFKEYAIFNTPSVLLINAMGQLPTIIIGYFYSPVAAGLYAIANRLVSIPVQALGSALSTTVTQHFASLISEGNVETAKKNAIEMHSKLFAFLLIPFSLLCVIGGHVVELLLGPQWLLAGNLVQWLSYFALSTLLAQAFGGLFDVMKRQKTRLKFHMANFIFRIGVLLICSLMDLAITSTIACFAVVANIMNLIAVKIAFDGIGAKNEITSSIISNIIPPLCMILCAWWLETAFSFVIAMIFSLIYCAIWQLVLLNKFYRKECISFFYRLKNAI